MCAIGRWGVLGVVSLEQGLPQGCGLAPLLFNISFAAMLVVAAKSFFDNPDVLKDIVCITRGDVTAHPRKEAYRCHLWSMVYADDAGIVLKPTEGLAQMIDGGDRGVCWPF